MLHMHVTLWRTKMAQLFLETNKKLIKKNKEN